MIAIVWRFQPARGRESEFEAAYGPSGAWAQLFRQSQAYVRTDLLRDDAGGYLTIDVWHEAGDFERFIAVNGAAYAQLDAECAALTAREEKIGVFTLLA